MRPNTPAKTQTYPATFQVAAAGKHAVYAVVTALTLEGLNVLTNRSLVAIESPRELPADLSGFPRLTLTALSDVKVLAGDTEDTIWAVEIAIAPIILTPDMPQRPGIPRQARAFTYRSGAGFQSLGAPVPLPPQ